MRDYGLLLVGDRVYVAKLLCVQNLRDLTVYSTPFGERSIILVLFHFWQNPLYWLLIQ